jgi:hypothetical protein
MTNKNKVNVKEGDTIRILNTDGQYNKWVNKLWVVNDVATNERQHRGYDNTMEGQGLVSCNNLPVSLYEYEFEVMSDSEIEQFNEENTCCYQLEIKCQRLGISFDSEQELNDEIIRLLQDNGYVNINVEVFEDND